MNLADKKTLNLLRFGTTKPNLLQRLVANFSPLKPFMTDTNNYWTATFNYQAAKKDELVSDGYSKNVSVYAVVKTISTVAAMAPWAIYKVKDRKKYDRYKAIQAQPYSTKQVFELQKAKSESLELDPHHYLNAILENPNSQQGMSEYMENLCGFKLTTGDGYEWADIGEVSKRIGGMYILPSQNIKILTTAAGTWPMPELGYVMQFGAKQIQFNANEVNHTKYWNPSFDGSGSHLYGFSPLDAAWLNVLQDNNAREAGVELLMNRGNRGIFTIESDAIKDYATFSQMKGAIKEEWLQNTKEYKDKISPMFGRGQWHSIGLGAKDLAILEICNMNKDDICNAYSVSSILFNNVDASTYNNYLIARKEMITRAVLPLLTSIRDSRNKKLSSGEWAGKDENIVFDFDQTVYTELDDDKKAIAEWMKLAECFSDNEIRVQLGFEPETTPWSKETWKKTNSVPASMIDKETITKMPTRNEQTV